MRKIIFVAVILFFAWGFYKKEKVPVQQIQMESVRAQQNPVQMQTGPVSPAVITKLDQTDRQEESGSAGLFKCDGRQYCTQMNSRAEAEFFIRNCPNTKMDGDGDGIPCENDTRF